MKYLNFILFLYFLCTAYKCTSQVGNKSFYLGFNHCYKPNFEMKENSIIYFETAVEGNKMNISLVKGIHSKDMYLRLRETLDCIDVSKITGDVPGYILTMQDIDNKTLEIDAFRSKYKIDSDTPSIDIYFIQTKH